MRKLLLGVLLAVASPAAAQSAGEGVYQVRFQGVTFTCGAVESGGTLQRLMHADRKIHLPVYEPAVEDAKAESWAIVYRIVCERGAAQQAKSNSPRQASRSGKGKKL
jgi:hypothetical protein